jgi:hypothetical protein
MKIRKWPLTPLCFGALCLSAGVQTASASGPPPVTLRTQCVAEAQANGHQCNDAYYNAWLDLADPPRAVPNPLPFGQINGDADYTQLGLVKGAPPQAWEDGAHTDPNGYSFEWWYYDAHFSDGSSVVLVYFTKPEFAPGAPETPNMSVTIVTAAGQAISKQFVTTPSGASFATDHCNVDIGPNTATDVNGNLEDYTLYAKIDDVEVNLNMQGLVPAWRPATGTEFLGSYAQSFGWIPSIPSGLTTGTMSYGGQTYNVVGSGYHDHNWGNVRLYDHLKYWWWSRSQIGPYTVVSARQRMKLKYGQDAWEPTFAVLDQNGALIDAATPGVTMTSTESNYQPHPDPTYTDGTIANTVTFTVNAQNGDWAKITLNAQGLLASQNLIPLFDMSLTPVERQVAQDIQLSPWYTRFGAAAALQFHINGVDYTGNGFSILERMDLE